MNRTAAPVVTIHTPNAHYNDDELEAVSTLKMDKVEPIHHPEEDLVDAGNDDREKASSKPHIDDKPDSETEPGEAVPSIPEPSIVAAMNVITKEEENVMGGEVAECLGQPHDGQDDHKISEADAGAESTATDVDAPFEAVKVSTLVDDVCLGQPHDGQDDHKISEADAGAESTATDVDAPFEAVKVSTLVDDVSPEQTCSETNECDKSGEDLKSQDEGSEDSKLTTDEDQKESAENVKCSPPTTSTSPGTSQPSDPSEIAAEIQSQVSTGGEATSMSIADHGASQTEQKNAPNDEKMKFEFVNSDGKFSLKVVPTTSTTKAEASKSTATPPTTPKKNVRDKPKVKRTKSSDKEKASPQRTKSGDKQLSGKQRNKVMSPVAPQKPLMDLRHILKKHEKKTEPIIQPVEQVGFYGSMSAIPFLKINKPEEKKKADEEKKHKKMLTRASTFPREQTTTDSTSLSLDDEPTEEPLPEKPKLPTKEEIVMTAEYDEAQLQLWKSMSALDGRLGSVERPQEMLPLRPGVRKSKKPVPQPNNAVRAFSRPEDWLNPPESVSPTKKSYRVSMTKQEMEDNILLMEPEEGAN